MTAQEAASILAGTPVTTRGTTPPGPQCDYRPAQRVVFSFQERSRTARIQIDSVVLTVYTGDQAASRYAAKQAAYGKDRDDQQVSGIGDKAIYTSGGELSVLRGTSFVNVSTQSDRDWGDGNTRYEDVHQKYLSLLVDLAKDALARMP